MSVLWASSESSRCLQLASTSWVWLGQAAKQRPWSGSKSEHLQWCLGSYVCHCVTGNGHVMTYMSILVFLYISVSLYTLYYVMLYNIMLWGWRPRLHAAVAAQKPCSGRTRYDSYGPSGTRTRSGRFLVVFSGAVFSHFPPAFAILRILGKQTETNKNTSG